MPQPASFRHLASLTGQSLGYGLGVFGRQLVIYLTLPLFTHHMPQAELGLVFFAVALMAFANALTNAGLPAATFRFYHDSHESVAQRLVLGSAFWIFLFFAIVPAICCVFFAGSLAQYFFGSAAYEQVIQVAALLLLVDTLVNFGYVLLRIQVRPFATSLSNFFIVVMQMAAALTFVIIYNLGAIGYLAGLLIGEVFGFALLAYLTRHLLSFRASRDVMGALLRYGLPLLPAAIAMWTLHLADRALIGSFAGLDELAIYAVAYKVAALVGLAIAPVRTAWPAFAFSVMHKPEAGSIYRDVLTYLTLVSMFVALGLLAFKADILTLLAPGSYATALGVVVWIVIAQVFSTVHLVLSIGPKISKRTFDLTIVSVLAACVGLLMNFLLIPQMGILGAAISTTVGYGLLAIGSYVIGQRSYRFPLDWPRLSKLLMAAGVSLFLIHVAEEANLSAWNNYLSKGCAWLSFLAFCMLFGIVDSSKLVQFSRLGLEAIRNRAAGRKNV